MSLAHDLRHAAALGWRSRLDLIRAVAELAIARARLAAINPEDLTADGEGKGGAFPSERQSALIDRVAFAIPRVAARVPWKATCLVQALAAQRWLERSGIDSVIVLGARKPVGGDMEAHAWLEAGGRTIIGGDSGDYQAFRRP